jgi:hypothetical protein
MAYSRNSVIQKRLTLCATLTLIFDIHLVSFFFLYRIRAKFLSAYTFYRTFSIKNTKRRENHDYYVHSLIETLPMFLSYLFEELSTWAKT